LLAWAINVAIGVTPARSLFTVQNARASIRRRNRKDWGASAPARCASTSPFWSWGVPPRCVPIPPRRSPRRRYTAFPGNALPCEGVYEGNVFGSDATMTLSQLHVVLAKADVF